MKRKTFMILMGAVFAALMALELLVDGLPTVFSSVMAFPFEQVGAGLRALALSGNIGNGLALALCIALSFIPILFALRHGSEKDHFRVYYPVRYGKSVKAPFCFSVFQWGGSPCSQRGHGLYGLVVYCSLGSFKLGEAVPRR